jgi:molecular chaperone DnaK (HSP70)
MSANSDDGDFHPNKPQPNYSDIVIVGIDFGTTYSGAAFTWGNKVDQIEVITSWESDLHGNSDEDKAPTVLSHKEGVRWGYDVPPESDQIRWFKLLLLDEKDVPDDIRRSGKLRAARKYLRKYRKTAISVIAEYLRLLWRHCEQRIAETISHRFVSYARFHIVITVPAIWPQYARVRMREAAQEAGLLEPRLSGTPILDIISEPEAAALATLRDMSDRSDIKVRSCHKPMRKYHTMLFPYQCASLGLASKLDRGAPA